MYGVEVLLVDNAHRLTQKAVSDIIELSKLYGISVILIEPPELDSVLDEEYNLFRPFKHFFRFEALSLEELTSILETFQEEFLGLPKASNFIDSSSIQTLFDMSEG